MRTCGPRIGSKIFHERAIRVGEFALGKFVEQIKRTLSATFEGSGEGIVDQLADVCERFVIAHFRDTAFTLLVKVVGAWIRGRCLHRSIGG